MLTADQVVKKLKTEKICLEAWLRASAFERGISDREFEQKQTERNLLTRVITLFMENGHGCNV